MLATLEQVLQIPNFNKAPQPGFYTQMLVSATRAIKTYCKRDLEMPAAPYIEYYDGNNQVDLVLRQRPVWNDSSLAVYIDPTGYGAQGAASIGFAPGTILTLGASYIVYTDGTPQGLSPNGQPQVSNRGLLRRVGGPGIAQRGWWPEIAYQGKLSASRLPVWPRGIQNIKVVYNAGYPAGSIPEDLQTACLEVTAWLIRNVPMGVTLQSESLGSYSYQAATDVLGKGEDFGTIRSLLSAYREFPL